MFRHAKLFIFLIFKDDGVFEAFSKKILGLLETWGEIPNTLISWVTPMILLGLTISIMWQGYGIMRGAGGQDHLLDVFFNSLRTFLVFALALGGGMYAVNILPLLSETRDALAGLFTDSKSSVYGQLDSTMDKTFVAYKKILKWGLDNVTIGIRTTNLTGLVGIVAGAFMVLFVVIYCLAAAINLLIIEFSLGVILALGPLFIACLAFTATNSFFNTWLSSVMKYLFTAVVITAVVGLGAEIVSNFSNKLSWANPAVIDYVQMTFSALVSTGILIILTSKAGSIGAELGGGMALQMQGVARAVKAAMNPIGAAASGASKVVGYGAGKAAGYLGSKAANSKLGQTVGGSRAMQMAMKPATMASNAMSGASRAMSQRSVMSATRSGFSSGSSSGLGKGTGTINK